MQKKSLKCKLWVKFSSSVCASSDDKWNKLSHPYSAFFFGKCAISRFFLQAFRRCEIFGKSTNHIEGLTWFQYQTCAFQGFRCASLFNVEGLDHLCLFFVTVEPQAVTIPRLKEGRIVCCDPAVKVSHFGLRLIEFQVRKCQHSLATLSKTVNGGLL